MKSDIIQEIQRFVAISPNNRLPYGAASGARFADAHLFDEPLVQTADGYDTLFEEYKTIIDPSYYTPAEAFCRSMELARNELPKKLSVVSWILPISESTRVSNRSEDAEPSRAWAHTRWYGEKFNAAMRRFVVALFQERGFRAVAPMLEPYFTVSENDKGLYSNWSERHTAYAAGLGTFSLSDGFITERGIAHRCGSVVTDCALEPDERTKGPFANCLYYFDGSCRSCIDRCPGGAITKKGHDKELCRSYQHEAIGYVKLKYGVEIPGCGLCQTNVPCEFSNPTD